MELLEALLRPAFMPHGHCYFWRPEMVWLQVVSNLIIGASYLSISLTLVRLTQKIRGIPFRVAYIAFGAFIVLCGVTHLMDVVTVWRGVYWIDGTMRALTAVASLVTAVGLVRLFPRAIDFAALIAAERAQSRAQLSESERHFRELVDNLPDLAWSARGDGFIEFYNQRWYEYTGATPEAMQGWGWRSVHHPEHVDEVERMWRAAIETGTAFEMEFPLRDRDGHYRWFLTRIRPLRDASGQIARWFGTNTDIDAQRRIHSELNASIVARDEFLSIASHELRTPLQSLTLQIEIAQVALRRGEAPEAIAKKLGTANRQIDRLAQLVETMLDVSRSGGGPLELVRARVDLVAVTREVIDRHGAAAARAGSTVTLHAPATLEGSWDRSRIDQVVTNLLSNAIKYGDGKPIEVRIALDGSHAELSLRDQGIGIAEAEQSRIFERFERGVSRNYGGLGLGLYISRKLARAHGGELTVASSPGEGACFVLRLPVNPEVTS